MKNSLSATFFVKIYFNPKSWPSEISVTPEVSKNIEVSAEELQKKIDEIHENIQEKNAKIREIDEQISQTQQRITELEKGDLVLEQAEKQEANGLDIMGMTHDEKNLIEAKDFLKTLESVRKVYVEQINQWIVEISWIEKKIQENRSMVPNVDSELMAEKKLQEMIEAGNAKQIEEIYSRIPDAKDMPQDALKQAMITVIEWDLNSDKEKESEHDKQWDSGKNPAKSLNFAKEILKRRITQTVDSVRGDKDSLKESFSQAKVFETIVRSENFIDSEKKDLQEIQDILLRPSEKITSADLKHVEEKISGLIYIDVFETLKKHYEVMNESGRIDEKILIDLESFRDLVDTGGYKDSLENQGEDNSDNSDIKKRFKSLKKFYKINNFLSKWVDKERWAVKKMTNIDFSRINNYKWYSRVAQRLDSSGLLIAFSNTKASQARYESLKRIDEMNQGGGKMFGAKNKPKQSSFIEQYYAKNISNEKIMNMQQEKAVQRFMKNFQTSEKFKQAFPQSVVTIGGRSINASVPASRETAIQAFLRWEPILITPMPDSSSIDKKQNREPMILQNTSTGIFTEYVGCKFPIHSSRNIESSIKLHLDLTRHNFTERIFRVPYEKSLFYFEKIFAKKFPDRRPEDEAWRFQETIFQEMSRASGISEFNVTGKAEVEKLLFKLTDPDFYKPLEVQMRQTGMMDEAGKITENTIRAAENSTQRYQSNISLE